MLWKNPANPALYHTDERSAKCIWLTGEAFWGFLGFWGFFSPTPALGILAADLGPVQFKWLLLGTPQPVAASLTSRKGADGERSWFKGGYLRLSSAWQGSYTPSYLWTALLEIERRNFAHRNCHLLQDVLAPRFRISYSSTVQQRPMFSYVWRSWITVSRSSTAHPVLNCNVSHAFQYQSPLKSTIKGQCLLVTWWYWKLHLIFQLGGKERPSISHRREHWISIHSILLHSLPLDHGLRSTQFLSLWLWQSERDKGSWILLCLTISLMLFMRRRWESALLKPDHARLNQQVVNIMR